MKPTKEQIAAKYHYDGEKLVFAQDSGRYGKYAAGTQAGSVTPRGVRMIQLDGKYYQAHQLIWTLVCGEWPERPIRHKNGCLDDNRISNLEMDGLARGKRLKRVDVERLKELLCYNPDSGVFTWKCSPRNRTLPGDVAGCRADTGYEIVVVDQQRIRLHHAAWAMVYGEMPRGQIDHINGVRHDNRIANLRLATHAQNMQNTAIRKDSTSGVKGVHLRKDTGKYSAQITVDGKSMYLGCFDTLEAAQNARLQAEIKHHPFRAHARVKD